MTTRKKILAGGGAAAIALALTIGAVSSPELAEAAMNIEGTNWKLVGSSKQTIMFDKKGHLGGNSGCNNYSAGYQLTKDKIKIGRVRSTRKMCISKQVMKQENDYLAMLSRAQKVKMGSGKLMLMDRANKVLATFKPAK